MAKKTVLITGCSDGGIGAAIAKAFHEQGFHVFATLRNTSRAGSLAHIDGIDILELDVTSKHSIDQCVQVVNKRTGGTLDVLVNNAGGDFVMPLLDVDVDEAKKLYDLNVWSMLAVTQAFAPMLISAEGVVCNIVSVVAILTSAWSGIYNSSKAAAKTLSETLRLEMKPLRVRVITGMIGAVHTRFHDNAAELNLPPNSYYQSAREWIDKQNRGLLKNGSQEVDVTARNVVSDIIGGASGQIWRGGQSSLGRFFDWLLPRRLFDYVINMEKGVSRVRRQEK